MDIKDYLKNNGITSKWFSDKIGISITQFSDFVNGRRLMPTVYWENIVAVSRGEVTLEDILKRNNKYYEKSNRIPHKKWRFRRKKSPITSKTNNTNSS